MMHRLIPERTAIKLNPEFRRYFGCDRMEVVELIGDVSSILIDGGTYRCRRLDGPEEAMDLRHDIHRSVFVPETPAYQKRKQKSARSRGTDRESVMTVESGT